MCAKGEPREWKMRLQDILDAIEKTKRYTAGMTLETFRQDEKTIDAVIRNLEIIGEAASHIPKKLQEKYPDQAWMEMRGMRNIIVHEYFGVSLPIIWHTITHDLDPLAEGLRKLLDE